MPEQNGTDAYTDEEWERASERVQAIREQAMANPVAAAAEARKYAEITNRVMSRTSNGQVFQDLVSQADGQL